MYAGVLGVGVYSGLVQLLGPPHAIIGMPGAMGGGGGGGML